MEEVREHAIKKYPRFEKLLTNKEARRRRLAALSFEDKIAIVNKWRRLRQTIRKNQLTGAEVLGQGNRVWTKTR
jgi:hypothetical protein